MVLQWNLQRSGSPIHVAGLTVVVSGTVAIVRTDVPLVVLGSSAPWNRRNIWTCSAVVIGT